MLLIGIILYIVGIFLFCLWDAAVGFPVNFDEYENPPLVIPAFFWPIALPILMICKFIDICSSLKTRRMEKEKRKEKIRIAIKREESQAIADAEREIETELRRQMRR